MNLFRRMSIRVKLSLLVLVLLLVAIGVGLFGLEGMKKTEEGLKTVYNDRVIPLKQLKQVSDYYAVNIVDTAHKVLSKSMSYEDGAKNVDQALTEVDRIWKAYTSTYLTPEESSMVEQVKPLLDTATTSANQLKGILQSKNEVALRTYNDTQLYKDIDPLTGKVGELVDLQLNVAKEEYDAAVQRYQNSIAVTTGVIVVGVILSLLIAFAIVYTIDHQLRLMQEGIRQDEYGRVSIKPIEVVNKDELGRLALALNILTTQVRAFIEQTHGSAEDMSKASVDLTENSQLTAEAANEISKAIEEIARGAADQARETERGAVEINSLAEALQQNIGQMQTLNLATQTVDTLKAEGMAIMQDLVVKSHASGKAIKDISKVIQETDESATKIEAASQMIKNIADQTNLLALNAAIEAARAGDAGRGFAVVAEEIRKLAEQSTSFTDEIGNIVSELGGKTEIAVNTMQSVAKIIEEQSQGVEKTNEKYEGISHAIDTVKGELSAMNHSLKEMEAKNVAMIDTLSNLSAISEENAAGAQQSTASIEEQTASMSELAEATGRLASLAKSLEEAIGGFEL